MALVPIPTGQILRFVICLHKARGRRTTSLFYLAASKGYFKDEDIKGGYFGTK